MRGASAESLAALTDELGPAKGLVPTIKEWASKLPGVSGHAEEDDGSLDARMADDLFGVADVLRREPSLRRTVTDVSVPAEAKARLARQVFERALASESMDLVASARNIIVAMMHTNPKGESKLLPQCTLPLTGVACVKKIITELAALEVTPEGFKLLERAPGVSVEEIKSKTAGKLIVDGDIPEMNIN